MKNNTINCYVAAVGLAFAAITALMSNSGSLHGFRALCYGTISLSFFFILISIGTENKNTNRKQLYKKHHRGGKKL